MFIPKGWQVSEMAEEIVAANTSPLFSGNDNYLTIGIPFIHKKLFAKRHERKYDSIFFLVVICRDPTTNKWVVEDYVRGIGDCRHFEIDIQPLTENTISVFFEGSS